MDRKIFYQLRKTDVALTGQNKTQPVVVFRNNRWHLVTVGFVSGAGTESKQGIVNVHFMSPYRARKTIREWFPYSEITPFEQISPSFREELSAKVLTNAEDYRPLLKKGLMTLAGGYTSDTLSKVMDIDGSEDSLITAIGQWMEKGKMGPFLHFEYSCEKFDIQSEGSPVP